MTCKDMQAGIVPQISDGKDIVTRCGGCLRLDDKNDHQRSIATLEDTGEVIISTTAEIVSCLIEPPA
jgi:hypothetical protein